MQPELYLLQYDRRNARVGFGQAACRQLGVEAGVAACNATTGSTALPEGSREELGCDSVGSGDTSGGEIYYLYIYIYIYMLTYLLLTYFVPATSSLQVVRLDSPFLCQVQVLMAIRTAAQGRTPQRMRGAAVTRRRWMWRRAAES